MMMNLKIEISLRDVQIFRDHIQDMGLNYYTITSDVYEFNNEEDIDSVMEILNREDIEFEIL